MSNERNLAPRGVPGVVIQLGRGTYVLAPVTVGKFRELEPEWNKLYETDGEGDSTTLRLQGVERQVIMAKFILASLQRNYSQVIDDAGDFVPLTEDSVLNSLLDVGNREAAFAATMGVSGLTPNLGEALAGTEMPAAIPNGLTEFSPDSGIASPSPTEAQPQAN